MGETHYADSEMLEMFGLSFNQSRLMFSVQKMITKFDYAMSKDKKKSALKLDWLEKWETGINTYLSRVEQDEKADLLELKDLEEEFRRELAQGNNRTWFYIIVLECIAFRAYTAIGDENDKKFSKCDYDEKVTYAALKDFFAHFESISEEKIDRLQKTYNKSINKIIGKANKIIIKVLIVVATAALSAALFAVAAGPIAVMIFGPQIQGLAGAALVNACLALAGGGAIAVGGGGMAHGIIVIAGGGALLGIAGGGGAVGIGEIILRSSPEFTLTQAAKLETILKEVILNAQQDILSAQEIIKSYQNQIDNLNTQVTEMELDNEKNKKALKNMKASLEYMKKSYRHMRVFASAYEEGLAAEA